MLLRDRSLIEHGDAVDLDIDTGPVRHAAKASSRDLLAAKVLAKGFVEAREIGDVPQNDSHVDDVLRGRASGLQYSHQIVECPARLHDNVALNDAAGSRIERAWPDTNNMLPNRMAWASGETVCPGVKPVVGAEDEVMICLGMEPPRWD